MVRFGCGEGCIPSSYEVGEVLVKGLWESRASGLWVSADSQAEPLQEGGVYGGGRPGHQSP